MKITFLDVATLGADLTTDAFKTFGEVVTYPTTAPDEVRDADEIYQSVSTINSNRSTNPSNGSRRRKKKRVHKKLAINCSTHGSTARILSVRKHSPSDKPINI